LPFLSAFRAPARMILFAFVGLAVLLALSFRRLAQPDFHVAVKYIFAVAFLCFFSWEMALWSIGRWTTNLDTGGVYAALKQNSDGAAVLELPLAIKKTGDISINVQAHMLYQPAHGHPLVVGRPSRHTQACLNLCENTDYLYELTHPQAILELYSNPLLAGRLRVLLRDGRSILRKNGIGYVVFHGDDQFFTEDLKSNVKRFLLESLGPEDVRDGKSRLLFKIY
jgi:hypothetical protein